MNDDRLSAFPLLADLDAASVKALTTQSQVAALPGGTTVFSPGMPCRNFLLVTSGSVRVGVVGETGREIVLYRVRPGEACVLTTACLMSAEDYGAEGITEGTVEALVVPAPTFHRLLAESEVFRRFAFDGFGSRIADLMLRVEDVAFGRIDQRLARFLLDHGDSKGRLALTHQVLASELGSAREVVSRGLKAFERKGWVALARGEIVVLDGAALENLAAL